MPLTIQPQFGSFIYASNGCQVEAMSQDGSVRGSVSNPTRSNIAAKKDGYLAPALVSLQGRIGVDGGGTRDTLRTYEDAFRYAHRPGYRKLYRDSDRYCVAEVESMTLGEDNGLLSVPYTLRFRAADPYWYDEAGAATDVWSSPTNGSSRGVTNGGSADVRPVFTFLFASTGTLILSFTNTTISGENAFSLGGAITSGDSLVVDCANQTVKLNGANKMSYFAGYFFKLDPGSNTLSLALSGVTLTSISTAFTKRYI